MVGSFSGKPSEKSVGFLATPGAVKVFPRFEISIVQYGFSAGLFLGTGLLLLNRRLFRCLIGKDMFQFSLFLFSSAHELFSTHAVGSGRLEPEVGEEIHRTAESSDTVV